MIIDSSGNVGIGASGQSQKLYVNGTSYFNGDTIVNGNLGIGTANYSANTKLTIKGASSGYSQPLVRIEQTAGWDGNYCLQTVGYTDLNGIRINGADTGNSIFTTGNNDMGLSTNAGAMKFAVNGAERMRINTSGNISIGSTDAFSYKLFVNGVSYLNGNLKVAGVANIHNNSPYAVVNNYMALGSLTIGGTLDNYGTATSWSSSTAGLLMECADYTEIAVHDGGTRLASLLYYDGPNNTINIGRDKGWGITNTKISNLTLANLTLANDTWHRSGEGNQRIYFAINNTTYIQGYAPTPSNNCIVFRNSGATDIFTLNDNANAYFVGEISAKFRTVANTGRDLTGTWRSALCQM